MPRFDPEQHARPLSIAGTLAVVAGLYSGHDAGWAVALLGVALLLTACYSRQDGFLLFGPFARADAVRSARSRRTHLVRAGIALAAGAVILGNATTYSNYGEADPAMAMERTRYVNEQIINWFAVSVGVIVPGLTVLLVSGTISEERTAKRWEVLLTTDLCGRELVFGKMLGKLWLVVEPVVVILPVLTILPLIVGLSPALMLLFGGTVFVTMLALAGLAAFASTSGESRPGMAGAVVVVVVIYLGLSAVMLLLQMEPEVWDFPRLQGYPCPIVFGDVVEAFNMANPFTTCVAVGSRLQVGPLLTGLTEALRQYSAGALGVFLVGTLLACQRVRPVKQMGRVESPNSRALSFAFQRWERKGLREKRAKLRPPVTDEPLAWWANCRAGVVQLKPVRARRAARVFAVCVAAFLAVYALDFVWQFTLYPLLRLIDVRVSVWDFSAGVRNLTTLLLLGTLAMSLVVPVVSAAVCVARERSGDTIESLRLTPLSAREMLTQWQAGYLRTNRLIVSLWAVPAAAAVVTGFYRPLTAVILALMALVLAPPLVSFALYCSAWASTPARAVRNLLFGGAVWHYLLLIAGVVSFFGVSALLDVDFDKLVSFRTDPMEFLLPTGPEWGKRTRTLRGDLVTIGITAVIVGLYYLVGRWVFNRAVGRFAKSRDATA